MVRVRNAPGLGHIIEIDPNLIIPDKELSINQRCNSLQAVGTELTKIRFRICITEVYLNFYEFSLDEPIKKSPQKYLMLSYTEPVTKK